MALKSVSGVSSEVITITFGFLLLFFSADKTSRPFFLGIHTSSSARSNLSSFNFFSAAAPSGTATTVYFPSRRISVSSSRVVRSSSATRMRVIISSAIHGAGALVRACWVWSWTGPSHPSGCRRIAVPAKAAQGRPPGWRRVPRRRRVYPLAPFFQSLSPFRRRSRARSFPPTLSTRERPPPARANRARRERCGFSSSSWDSRVETSESAIPAVFDFHQNEQATYPHPPLCLFYPYRMGFFLLQRPSLKSVMSPFQ